MGINSKKTLRNLYINTKYVFLALMCNPFIINMAKADALILEEFNDTSHLEAQFNPDSSGEFTNLSDSGIGDTGSINVPLGSRDLWTTKGGYSVTGAGNIYKISAFFKIKANAGYGGLGLAVANQNEPLSPGQPAVGIGATFHGGGGAFHNNGSSYTVSWYDGSAASGLAIGNWYQFNYTLTAVTANTFDAKLQIINSDANGNLGSVFTTQTKTGLVNDTVASASKVHVYFSSYGSRIGKIDNFLMNLQGGVNYVPEVIDTDGDGDPDITDPDDDGDSVPDEQDAFPLNPSEHIDTDGDGTGNNADTDDDNDGTLDSHDAFPLDSAEDTDTDSDGQGNNVDTDDDNDGTLDSNDAFPLDSAEDIDTDNDGLGNNVDTDDDNDGTLDNNDAFPLDSAEDIDTDNDGQGNNADTDDDNDDFTDAIEISEGSDPLDPESHPLPFDSDHDTIIDAVEQGRDTDHDGIEDHLDLDSDNDGIFDLLEALSNYTASAELDTNSDGMVDADKRKLPSSRTIAPVDFDGDAIPDYRDLDSDNDGISDSVEVRYSGNAPIQDSSGKFNLGALQSKASAEPLAADRMLFQDQDKDGIANYRDLDSDNDGLNDLLENNGIENNVSGRVHPFVDANLDGMDDALFILPLTVLNTDSDALPDYLDLDSDQDGISDLFESSGVDMDDNGIIDDYLDADGDGWNDFAPENQPKLIDTDKDGIPNTKDLDSDNDGINDLVESGGVDSNNDGIIDTAADSDADGINDNVDVDQTGGTDIDNDGIDDRFDASQTAMTDTDGDGIADDYDTDPNGDGLVRSANWVLGQTTTLPDTDGDGIPDITDVDNNAETTGSTPDLGAAATEEGTIRTNLNAGGCSINNNASFDPVFLVLLLLALAKIIYRHRRNRALQRTSIALLCALLIQGNANAEKQSLVPYVGVGIGASHLEPDTSDSIATLDKRVDMAKQLTIGLDLTKDIAMELSYADLGGATLNKPHGSVNYRSTNLTGLYHIWNDELQPWSIFARLGLGRMQTSSSLSIEQSNDYQAVTGVGLDYLINEHLNLRAQYIHYDADSSQAGLSLLYRFKSGDKQMKSIIKEAKVLEFETKPEVDAQADKAEKPVTQAVRIEPPKSTLPALPTLIFAYKKSSLEAYDASELSELAEWLNGNTHAVLHIIGHTDGTGSMSYNQRLSEQRAEAVKQEMLKLGVSTTSLLARGEGKTKPVASNNTTTGQQENRRVELRIE